MKLSNHQHSLHFLSVNDHVPGKCPEDDVLQRLHWSGVFRLGEEGPQRGAVGGRQNQGERDPATDHPPF